MMQNQNAFNKVRLILRWDMLQFGCGSELHEDTLIHGKLSQFACIFKYKWILPNYLCYEFSGTIISKKGEFVSLLIVSVMI